MEYAFYAYIATSLSIFICCIDNMDDLPIAFIMLLFWPVIINAMALATAANSLLPDSWE